MSFLVLFFRNLMMGENNELKKNYDYQSLLAC